MSNDTREPLPFAQGPVPPGMEGLREYKVTQEELAALKSATRFVMAGRESLFAVVGFQSDPCVLLVIRQVAWGSVIGLGSGYFIASKIAQSRNWPRRLRFFFSCGVGSIGLSLGAWGGAISGAQTLYAIKDSELVRMMKEYREDYCAGRSNTMVVKQKGDAPLSIAVGQRGNGADPNAWATSTGERVIGELFSLYGASMGFLFCAGGSTSYHDPATRADDPYASKGHRTNQYGDVVE
ncbi:hypothetical protein BDK51DRAFT_45866 [Blyttiomyces helicus]|uniref:Uncharacterized protein n=1 Tax=Blyttiomyces helicus TaxID=388810 RepID=A0A4P9W506_9FUNG|nr:hypothetical protein BDK51DRAFT_45866 [Blyttiomyces helicus]|eukprot:RKO87459.1 hypothetical protein BDK51DRAFT_45866 [Blyttiomyces helicus]